MHPLLDPISAHHRAAPDKPVVADASLVLSGAEFLVVARHLAKQITSRNTGAHVGVLAPPSAAGAVAIAACWCAGRVPVPLNFLLRPDELHRVTRDAGLDLILAEQGIVRRDGHITALRQFQCVARIIVAK